MDKREKMFEHLPKRRLYAIEIYRLESLFNSKGKINSGLFREVLMRAATANEKLFFFFITPKQQKLAKRHKKCVKSPCFDRILLVPIATDTNQFCTKLQIILLMISIRMKLCIST